MKPKHLWSTQPSCLDSAYNRLAIEQGMADGDNPTFPENNVKLHYLGYGQEDTNKEIPQYIEILDDIIKGCE